MKSNQKKVWITVAAVAVIAVLMCAVYFIFMPQGNPGAKTIGITVVMADASEKEYTLHTDQEFLRGALEEENLIAGTESEFGLFVTKVAGVEVNAANEEWWCFTKDGEMVMTGVDTTPVADNDHFEITLTVGYEAA